MAFLDTILCLTSICSHIRTCFWVAYWHRALSSSICMYARVFVCIHMFVSVCVSLFRCVLVVCFLCERLFIGDALKWCVPSLSRKPIREAVPQRVTPPCTGPPGELVRELAGRQRRGAGHPSLISLGLLGGAGSVKRFDCFNNGLGVPGRN